MKVVGIIMKINVDRCYFHSIQPLLNYKLKNKYYGNKKNWQKGVLARLDFMLSYGYLVPGKDLRSILPEEYKEEAPHSFYGDDSVYLAQTTQTELPSVGGSYFDGEFSAYCWHISNSHALVFGENVIENKKIEMRNHSLSEEVCIQDKVSLADLVALQLPYETPLSTIKRFITCCEEDFFAFDNIFLPISQGLASKAKKSIEDTEAIEKIYAEIQMFEDCLRSHQKAIPCIHQDGSIYNKQEEYEYLEANREKALKLIKEVEKIH